MYVVANECLSMRAAQWLTRSHGAAEAVVTSYFRLHASDFVFSHRGRRDRGGNPDPPSFHAGCQGTRSVESPRGRYGLRGGAME